MFLASFLVGYISDHAVNSGRVSAGIARKLFNSVGFMGPAGGLICLAFVGCNSTLAVTALVVSNTIAAFAHAGFNVSTESSVYLWYGWDLGITEGVSKMKSSSPKFVQAEF
jgi:hypothetical protein